MEVYDGQDTLWECRKKPCNAGVRKRSGRTRRPGGPRARWVNQAQNDLAKMPRTECWFTQILLFEMIFIQLMKGAMYFHKVKQEMIWYQHLLATEDYEDSKTATPTKSEMQIIALMVHSVALFSRSGAIEIFGWPIFPETHNGRKIFGFIFMSPSLCDATQCMQIGMTPRSTPPRDKVEPANRRRRVAIMGGARIGGGAGKYFPLVVCLEFWKCLIA